MKKWQQRVVEEKEALDDKLKRLIELPKSEKFKGMTVQNIKWLNRQRLVMELYSDILAERIALFE